MKYVESTEYIYASALNALVNTLHINETIELTA